MIIVEGMNFGDPKFEKEMNNLKRARNNVAMRIPAGDTKTKKKAREEEKK